jgi:hypothetical protein
MPPYIESGLRLDLPTGLHFRFADTAAYNAVKGQSVKEMDFAWVDSGKLFLLEVRSYTQVSQTLSLADFVPVKGQPEPFRFSALIDKVTDSVLMMLAAWTNTAWGQQLKTELPAAAQSRMPLKLVIAVELPPALTIHLQGLRDSLNARLRGRAALADVGSVVLIDYVRLTSDPVFKGFVALHP